jgi:hypothetical protein
LLNDDEIRGGWGFRVVVLPDWLMVPEPAVIWPPAGPANAVVHGKLMARARALPLRLPRNADTGAVRKRKM